MTPRAPRAGRRLVTLSASLALHGGLLLAVLLAVSGETEPGALFIDLTEDVRSEAAGAGAGQPAASPTGRGGAHALRPIVAARSAPAPSPSLGTAEPSPEREPAPAQASNAKSPAVETLAPPPPVVPPAPVGASEPTPAPRATEGTDATEATDASAPGASGAALSPSSAGAVGGWMTDGGVLPAPGVRGGAPGGAPDVSRGFALVVPGGGGGGGIGPGAEYGAYLGRLRARVQQSLRYPLAARRRGLSGTVHVEIIIRPDGVISAVAVADSSAHAVLDDAAVETIRRLAPEPLPRDVPPRTLRVRLPVVFALE